MVGRRAAAASPRSAPTIRCTWRFAAEPEPQTDIFTACGCSRSTGSGAGRPPASRHRGTGRRRSPSARSCRSRPPRAPPRPARASGSAPRGRRGSEPADRPRARRPSDSTTPPSMALMRLPATRTTPKPVLATPGSIPMTTIMGSDSGPAPGCLFRALELARDLLQDLVRNVEVRVHGLHVVVLVETPRRASAGGAPRPPPPRPSTSAPSRSRPSRPRRRQRSSASRTAARSRRVARDLEQVAVGRDVLGAGVDGDEQVVLRVAVAVDRHHPSLLEDPGHRSGLAEAAAVLVEEVTDVGARSVAVVGECLDQYRRAAGAVALVDHALDLLAVGARARCRDRSRAGCCPSASSSRAPSRSPPRACSWRPGRPRPRARRP